MFSCCRTATSAFGSARRHGRANARARRRRLGSRAAARPRGEGGAGARGAPAFRLTRNSGLTASVDIRLCRYEGEFFEGSFHGRGRYTFADGGYYDGDYLAQKGGYSHGVIFPRPDGKKHGRGVRVWVSGNKYEGEWLDDQIEGEGSLEMASGGKYTGTFEGGKRNGCGVESWGNRLNIAYRCPMGYKHPGIGFCRYDGEWKGDQMDGSGTFACIDGRE